MIDKTTEGITVEPEEVEAVLHNLCGYHLSQPDPADRYASLTQEQVLYEALVGAIKRERGRALADLVAAGHTVTHVAQVTNLGSRQRVQRLIAISRAAEEAAAAVRAASREFEAKLAAVEATLDEVVSGITGEMPAVPPPAPAAAPPPQSAPSPWIPPEPVVITVEDDVVVRSPLVAPDDEPAPVRDPHDDLFVARSPLVEPTRVLPAVRFFDADGEDDPAGPADEPRWWRRGRDTGAA